MRFARLGLLSFISFVAGFAIPATDSLDSIHVRSEIKLPRSEIVPREGSELYLVFGKTYPNARDLVDIKSYLAESNRGRHGYAMSPVVVGRLIQIPTGEAAMRVTGLSMAQLQALLPNFAEIIPDIEVREMQPQKKAT